MISRIRLLDITPYDGLSSEQYSRAIKALSSSLAIHNAAIIELGIEDTTLIKCGLEATHSHFKSRTQLRSSRDPCTYRPGWDSIEHGSSPPCMSEAYKRMAKAARIILSAIAKHLRLRTDSFNQLLDDAPLNMDENSSSILVASFSDEKGSINSRKNNATQNTDKGFLSLISCDFPGVQVFNPNGKWVQADNKSEPGNVILVTGKALAHVTGGLRPAATYRIESEFSGYDSLGRSSLIFKLMPHDNAVLDCSMITAAGHTIPQNYGPISANHFLNGTSSSDDLPYDSGEDVTTVKSHSTKDKSFKSFLTDPISGAFLEDAMVVSCGHSFGGLMLEKVVDLEKCPICQKDLVIGSLTPNIALRNAAELLKKEGEARVFHKTAGRKRRRVSPEENGYLHPPNMEEACVDSAPRNGCCPFYVNDKVVVVGNMRTAERHVGKEGIITSPSFNGWCSLRMCDSGENARFQFRSLRKVLNPQPIQKLRFENFLSNGT